MPIFAEVGMEITDDVFDRTSKNLLFPAGTVLTPQILRKLGLYGIRYVNINESKERVTVDDGWVSSIITESVEFKQFLADYDKTRSLIHAELQATLEMGKINTDRINRDVFSLTQTIVTRSQVLNYLRYINQGDDATVSHCLNVGILCCLFGLWLNWSSETISLLVLAGVCHDIGKKQVPFEILYKPGRLTNEEFDEVKKHTVYGYKLLKAPNIPREVKHAALMHHEKADGSGYPLGKTMDSINLYAAIVAICDVYEAMTSDRIYRARVSPFDVIQQFERGEFGALREDYLCTFTQKVAEVFLNNTVLLNDDRECVVKEINKHDLAHPIICCSKTNELIDLSKDKSVHIINVI